MPTDQSIISGDVATLYLELTVDRFRLFLLTDDSEFLRDSGILDLF